MAPRPNRPARPWAMAVAGVSLLAVAWQLARGFAERSLGPEEELPRRDPLTGVGNRVLLRDRLEHALARSERSGNRVAVLFVDIDRFKDVNDQYGHEIGDGVLRTVAERLTSISRRGDTIARLGGDEFTVVLEGLDDAAGAATVAQKILDTMEDPIPVNGRSLTVTVSVGVAITPDDGTTAHDLLQHADQAMYSAKAAGRRRYQFSTSALREANEARVRMVRELREAIEAGDLRLLYQPQVEIATREVVAVEALVRWVRPGGTEIPAAAFIEVAEDTDLMQPLTDWVLDRACADAAAWAESGLEHARVAVNLSPTQFTRGDLAKFVGELLDTTGLHADRLELEVTEQALAARPDLAAEQLHALAAMGVTLSVDDFGTGHSSLRNLERFPLHALKIAEPLVAATDTEVPHAIVDLAQRFGLSTVAEGVETGQQLEHLERIGCERAQGFFISRPLPNDELLEWAATRDRSPEADVG